MTYTHQELLHITITMLNMMQFNGMMEGYSDTNPAPTGIELDTFVKELLEVLNEEGSK